MNYKEFFKDKKIAVVGLGSHLEMMTDVKFMIRCGAILSIYDIRSDKRLKNISSQLKILGVENIELGKISDDKLLDFDLIILSHEISQKSFFLKKAIQKGVRIEYPEILFFKLAPPITLVGIVGEYGKSTVTNLVYSLLKKSFADYDNQGLFLIDPENIGGTLSYLKKIKKDDVVVAKIPEGLMIYFHQIRISPHVAVVTSVIPFDILEFQTYNNFIVAHDEVVDSMKSQESFSTKAKILRIRPSMIPLDWEIPKYPVYQHSNFALAQQTAELFKVSSEVVRQIIQTFTNLKGRLEFVKKVDGIEFYNDATSVTPSSTLSALESLYSKEEANNIILIMGGAYTGKDYSELIKKLSKYVTKIVLISSSGVIGLIKDLENISDIEIFRVISLEDAVIKAKELSKKGDRVLYSPGFEAVGVDLSRRERSDKFVKAVRSL